MKRSAKPSGSTPGKPAGKVNRTGGQHKGKNIKSRKNLFNFKPEKVSHPTQSPVWSTEERRALVEYVALFTPVEEDKSFKWPSTKDPNFWDKCADALTCTTGMPLRSGSACRYQVNSFLRKRYATLEEAEDDLQVNYFCGGLQDIHSENSSTLTSPRNANSTPQARLEKNTPLSPILVHSPHANSTNHETYNHGDTITKVVKLLTLMTSRMRGGLIQNLFWQYMFLELDHDFRAFIPSDFIKLCCKGIDVLHSNGKENVLYYLARGLGIPRKDGSGPRLPIDKMPFGLLSYNIRYFGMDTVNNISSDPHFVEWETTMFSNFGHKWICLQRGPGFAYDEADVDDSSITSNTTQQGTSSILEQAWNQTFQVGTQNDCLDVETLVDTGDRLEVGAIVEAGDGLEVETVVKPGNPLEVRTIVEAGDGLEVETDVEAGDPLEVGTIVQAGDGLEVGTVVEAGDGLEVETVVEAGDGLEVETLVEAEGELEVRDQVNEVSYLWARLGSEEREEIANGDRPVELEIFHGIRPKAHKKKRKEVDPMKAKVNVAGHSVRTLQRHIQAAEFSRDTNVQVAVLKKIKERNKNGRWWIKADACDLRKGLRESMRHEWAGDCDLGDGKLQSLYQKYMDRKTFYGGLGLKDRRVRMKEDMALVISGLDKDLKFLVGGEKAAKDKYAAKQRQSNASEDGMFALAWECECFQTLININKDLKSSISSLHLRISTNQRDCNIAGDLTSLRQRLLCYAKDLFSKHREAASHLMVFMIADEKRDMKPYAVPVRFVPYHSVTDHKLRELCMELRSAMVNLGMVVVGTVTDGEFNSIRTMGSKRAISIIQLMMDSKSEARSTNVNTIRRYFTPVAVPGANGTFFVRGQAQHPAIAVEDIVWLYEFMNADGNQVPFERAIHILKRKLFPANYDPYPWDTKKAEEDTKGCLKSLMATYLFRYKIKRMKEELNVDFSKHLYQPELCDVTGEYIHEREDHNHVLKRITECLRAGEIPGVDTRYFRDALHDADSGLTYEALTGKQKQSVPHCEQVFSKGVLEFMQRNGHTSEAHFVETVRNWHKAADGRGLSEETRSKYNNDMINFLLTDWMPWHEYERDFSTIDVMRPIKGIKGFTREIVVALIANCESLELRRAEYQERGLPPEHPRASSTDDVEGFIAHLHDQLGDVFDHKEFLEQQPKILNEFTKKIDPELQFHYWTGHRHRFTTDPLPSFNDASGQTERLDRVRLSRRSDPGVFVANRASLPQRNSLTVRASFHRAPEQLPPPPTV